MHDFNIKVSKWFWTIRKLFWICFFFYSATFLNRFSLIEQFMVLINKKKDKSLDAFENKRTHKQLLTAQLVKRATTNLVNIAWRIKRKICPWTIHSDETGAIHNENETSWFIRSFDFQSMLRLKMGIRFRIAYQIRDEIKNAAKLSELHSWNWNYASNTIYVLTQQIILSIKKFSHAIRCAHAFKTENYDLKSHIILNAEKISGIILR